MPASLFRRDGAHGFLGTGLYERDGKAFGRSTAGDSLSLSLSHDDRDDRARSLTRRQARARVIRTAPTPVVLCAVLAAADALHHLQTS